MVKKYFPIMDGIALPFEMIAGCEKRCMTNHNQTLDRLIARNGLSAVEAIGVLDDKDGRWVSNQIRLGRSARWAKALGNRVRAHYEKRLSDIDQILADARVLAETVIMLREFINSKGYIAPTGYEPGWMASKRIITATDELAKSGGG